MAGRNPSSNYTRRTHIVRIDMDGGDAAKDGPSNATNYIDVEVLDAIAFRDDRNKELILNFEAAKPVPYITDSTGGGHGKAPSATSATRRSHMKRISQDGQKLDVEVIDAVAFRDNLGKEWILNMPDDGSVAVFNTTDGGGGSKATRRVHTEKVKAAKSKTDYLSVVRNDTIAFRTIQGKELILKAPSNNDPDSSDPAAASHTTPSNYDPDNEDGPVPPNNTDPNIYVAPVKGADGFMTGSAKIMQGPLWWIRKVSPGGGLIYVDFVSHVTKSGGTALPLTALVSVPYAEGRFDIMSDNRLAKRGASGQAPAITDPVTVAMRGYYSQWTPPKSPVSSSVTSSHGETVWITDATTWTFGVDITGSDVGFQFDGPESSFGPLGAPGSVNSANVEKVRLFLADFDARFFGDPMFGGGPPDYPRFNAIVAFGGAQGGIGLATSGTEPAQFWDNGGQAHSEIVGGTSTTTRMEASLIINVAALKAAIATKAEPNPTTGTFTVTVGNDPHGSYTLSATGYKTRKDFPVDAKNEPTWADWSPTTQSGGPPSVGDTITVTVNFKTLAITMSGPNSGPPQQG